MRAEPQSSRMSSSVTFAVDFRRMNRAYVNNDAAHGSSSSSISINSLRSSENRRAASRSGEKQTAGRLCSGRGSGLVPLHARQFIQQRSRSRVVQRSIPHTNARLIVSLRKARRRASRLFVSAVAEYQPCDSSPNAPPRRFPLIASTIPPAISRNSIFNDRASRVIRV